MTDRRTTASAGKLRTIRQAQGRVQRRIEAIKAELAKIRDAAEGAEVGPRYESAACMVGDLRVWCLKEVTTPRPDPREELLGDLAGLEARLKALGRRERRLAHRARLRARADRRSRRFHADLVGALEEGAQNGQVDDEVLDDLREESEAVLVKYVNLLQGNPSMENINRVLEHLEVPHQLGGGARSGASGAAWDALVVASTKLRERAQHAFDRSPTVANFDTLLARTRLKTQLAGGSWTLPDGFERANTTHTVAAGDSLSAIAETYYRRASYWPYIYRENLETIDDPADLPVGVRLRIP